MKSMNVKKLVALGVAAAIAAMPVAHAAQTFNTGALPTAKDWYLNSVVVVGHGSAPSDAVWAGNIAAAIANMAYTEETKTITADISGAKVKLSVPGEMVVGGNGKTEEYDLELNGSSEVSSETFTNADIPVLASSAEITYKYKKSGDWQEDTAYYTEKLHVDKFNVEGYRPEDSQIAELRAETDEGKVYYELELRSLAFETNKTYTSDDIDNLKVPLLGRTLEITKLTFDSSGNLTAIEMATSESDVTVPVGESVDYEGYKVKVVDIDPDNKQAYLELIDAQGNVVADDVVKVDESTDFDGKLEDPVVVESVFSGETTKFAKLGLKSGKISLSGATLEKEDIFDADGWKLTVTGDNETITFKVSYVGDDEDSYLSLEKGLKEGEAMKFPGDKGLGIVFAGLTAKPMKDMEFDGTTVKFIDADGVMRTAKLAFDKDYEDGALTTVSNIIDGKDMKIEVSGNTLYYDADMTWESGEDITADENVDLSGGAATIGLDVDGDGDNEVFYVVQKDGTTLHFIFGGHEVEDVNGGTGGPDLGATATLASTDELPYKVSLAYDDNNTTDLSNHSFYWKVTERVTPAVGSAVTIEIYPKMKEDKSYVFDALDFEDKAIKIGGTEVANAKSDDSVPENALTPFVGSTIHVIDSDTVKIEVPTEARKVKFFFGEVPQTIETTGEIEAGVGETVKIGDYEVKIEDVTAEGATATYTEVKPIKLDRLVYLDNEVPSGKNLIVVGGYFVNSIAEAIANEHPEIKDAVAAEGDYIVDKYTYNGRDAILVFGYTAEDTAAAAQEFLNWLKSNVQ